MSYDWTPHNWKEWVGLLVETGLVIALLGWVWLQLPSTVIVWVGFAVSLLFAAAVIFALFALSRWVFRKLRTRFAVERLPKMPKEP